MSPELPRSKEDRLNYFREAIRIMVENARKGTREGYGTGGHFSDLFNVEDLDQEDFDLYAQYKTGSVDLPELQMKATALKGSNNGSKKEFMSYLISRIQQELLDRS